MACGRSFSTPIHPSTPVGAGGGRPVSLQEGMRAMSMGELETLPKRNSGPAGRRRPTHVNGAPVGAELRAFIEKEGLHQGKDDFRQPPLPVDLSIKGAACVLWDCAAGRTSAAESRMSC
eukprot:2420171-Rhodomonas_salina.2